uniref:CBM21 domain-containing protein n=1 Tax=Ciona savignyi TaxID=51511 RepID=H2Z2N9_CIOSA
MPADVSYLYSVSPPFHSAFASDFYAVNKRATEYNCGANHNSFGRFPTSYSTTLETIAPPKVQNLYPSHTDRKLVSQLKLKSIISQKKVATNSNNDRLNRKDKKVTFADTQGQSLTLIKYLTESTNEPPKSMTSGDLIRDLVKNLSLSCSHSEPNSKEKKFTFKFAQPVANYVQFKRRIELHNVSLENIMVKSNSNLCGTVKVKNLSFNKTVMVRVTFNNWESYLDHPSQYVRNAYENGALDTFHFN